MNPGDLRMLWMNQYSGERMIFDDSTSFYGQPSVGLSVMDDISHPTAAIDINPMMSIVGGEYGGQGAPIGGGHAAPTATLIPTGTGADIYGISHTIGGLHPVLHHTTPYQPYQDMIDDDVDQKPFVHGYEQIDDYEISDPNGLVGGNREIINIDDFVTMNNDSDSYQENQMMDEDDDEIIEEKPQILVQNIEPVDSGGGGGGGGGGGVASGGGGSRGSGNNKKARKIEPVNRPGLVLKTPIAYKGNIDPSVIPIQRDGMAVCERCGAIGVKHTFYTKSRRYCSMACARGELYTLVCNDNSKSSTASTSASTSSTSSFATNAGVTYKNQISGLQSNNTNAGAANGQPNSRPTDIELEFRVSHIKNSNYRFKMSNEQTGNLTGINGSGENGMMSDEKTLNSQQSLLYRDVLPLDDVPQIPKTERLPSPCPRDDRIMSIRKRPHDYLNSFDWTRELSKPNFYAAPVTCFPHAPGYDMWDNIGMDMKVEVENTDCDNHNQMSFSPGTPHSFWVATVLNISGYKALMRYEGFDDESHDFWVNLCSSEVHAVGWCATRGKPLIPPKSIEDKYSDWKDFLVERLSGARTLPSNFYNKISDSFKSRFRIGLILELVDKNRISQVKLATVCKIVGKRLFLKYYDSDDGFWCHEDSPIIHPVGWATTVGHNLEAPHDYLERMHASHNQMIEVHEDDATIELFKMNFTFEEYYLEGKTNGFVEGMKLEAVDPLNLSSICVATVMAVMKFGYMMIRIDSYDPDATGADWFCYHEKSPSIFPVGFCAANGIPLTPPHGYDINTFSWDSYLDITEYLPADQHLFHREIPNHGFEPNMKLECADLMDPRLVCVATVARVVGRLLKIRFDGWPEEYDQWLDCESPDIYPVGWCILVGHKLEGPPIIQQPVVKHTPKTTRKKRKKKIKTESGAAIKTIGRPPNVKKEMQDAHPPVQNFLTDENRVCIKLEMKAEPEPNEEDDEEDDDEDYDDDISQSDRSASLPVTPEPGEKLKLIITSSSTPPISSSNTITITGNNIASPNVQQPSQKTTSPAPPAERKATSYIANSSVICSKYIPRLIDTDNAKETSSLPASAAPSTPGAGTNELIPDTWNIYDVSQFLRVNDCTAYCDTFSRNKIDGKKLLDLSKDEIITLLGMKVGPALKIFDLIQQLKCKANPTKVRLLKTSINKKFS